MRSQGQSGWSSWKTSPCEDWEGTGGWGLDLPFFFGGLLLMAEIRVSPIEVGSLSHWLQGFSTVPGGCPGFLNHQQYHKQLFFSFWWVSELISGLTAHFCTGNPSDFFGDPTGHSQQVSNGRSQICPSRVWFLTLSLSSDRPPKMEGSFLIHFPIVLAGDQDPIVTLHFACIQVSFSHAVLPHCLIKLGKRALHWSCARKAPCNFAQISSWPCSVQPFPFSSYPFCSQLCWLSQEPSFHRRFRHHDCGSSWSSWAQGEAEGRRGGFRRHDRGEGTGCISFSDSII